MSYPTMSVINFTTTLSDRKVQAAVRAVNRQVSEDFAAVWGAEYSLRLHAADFDPTGPDSPAEEPVRGESVMYLIDESTVQGALGFHDLNTSAVPVGFVFVLDPDDWTTTLSHEVLELIIDPTVNVMVPGPDPRNAGNLVLHAYEVCDAVERTSYEIDGVLVSNFITQSWFTAGDELGTRNDFLGVGVESFNATPGSHLAFFDLAANQWVTFFGQQAAASSVPAGRAQAFEHAKPERPDTAIQGALESYKKKPMAKDGEGLPFLRGITRSARYAAVAEGLARYRGVGK